MLRGGIMKEKKYLLDRRSFPVRAALVCLLLGLIFRGVSGLLNRVVLEDRLTFFAFLLFLGSCLLYGLSLLLFGRKWLWVTTGPFVLGVMAFVARLFTYDNLLQVEVSIPRLLISMLFYLVVTAVYSATVCGGLRGKWFLVLLFLFPLAGHVVFDIIPAFRQGVSLSASQILAELSVLVVLIGMVFTALSMRHTIPEPAEKKKKGEEVTPPQPGDKLDEKPAVVSDPEPAAEPAVEEAAPEAETPPSEAAETPAEEEPAVAAEEAAVPEESEKPAEPEAASDAADEPEAGDYDPFAPSTEPIRLTLDPFAGGTPENTEETENNDTGDENG